MSETKGPYFINILSDSYVLNSMPVAKGTRLKQPIYPKVHFLPFLLVEVHTPKIQLL